MERTINFKDSEGNNVVAIYLNSNENLDAPIVVIGHGFTSSKNGSAKSIAGLLSNIGINSLRIDFYGHGESDGKFEDVTVSHGVDDVLSAINFLDQKGHTDIHYLGTSYGGACGILAAAKTDKLRSLILRSPVADFWTRELMRMPKEKLLEWKNQGYRMYIMGNGKDLRLNYSFLQDMEQTNGFAAAKNIEIPTLIVHGDQDESVPILLSEMLVKVIVNSKLVVIKDADHRYSDPIKDKEAVEVMINALREYKENHEK